MRAGSILLMALDQGQSLRWDVGMLPHSRGTRNHPLGGARAGTAARSPRAGDALGQQVFQVVQDRGCVVGLAHHRHMLQMVRDVQAVAIAGGEQEGDT